jgi:hypothetical protein
MAPVCEPTLIGARLCLASIALPLGRLTAQGQLQRLPQHAPLTAEPRNRYNVAAGAENWNGVVLVPLASVHICVSISQPPGGRGKRRCYPHTPCIPLTTRRLSKPVANCLSVGVRR